MNQADRIELAKRRVQVAMDEYEAELIVAHEFWSEFSYRANGEIISPLKWPADYRIKGEAA